MKEQIKQKAREEINKREYWIKQGVNMDSGRDVFERVNRDLINLFDSLLSQALQKRDKDWKRQIEKEMRMAWDFIDREEYQETLDNLLTLTTK